MVRILLLPVIVEALVNNIWETQTIDMNKKVVDNARYNEVFPCRVLRTFINDFIVNMITIIIKYAKNKMNILGVFVFAQ